MYLAYEELLEKYNQLLKENEELKNEIATLKGKRGMYTVPKKHEENESKNYINKHSSPQEKISVFRSLFKGREDVFARRWYSKALDKSGYQPVCGNEWDMELCNKKKFKCSTCPNRKLMPITDRDIYRHLSGKDLYGRDVVGIYPMLPDETCLFLCADFDEERYKEDVSEYRKICQRLGVPVSVEISRSGNGAHAWIFFSEPISATTARKLGSGILTKAMENSDLSFKSYDRFFPNQDTMPKGGFGNLVALPLQGNARKKGGSIFVDENFTHYCDQWEYLSSVEKISSKKVDEIVAEICRTGDLGVLASSGEGEPWQTKKQIELSTDDFPESLEIVYSNMLYISTNNLSPILKNKLKRLVAFKNPDFYRSQAMRLPTYNKPRIISTADVINNYIALPRGCLDALYALFDGTRTKLTLRDKTNPGKAIPVKFNGALREEQQPAADALLSHDIGVLSATTAFGKTVIASYLISEKKTNTLVLVHTQSLMTQWQKSLEYFLSIEITSPDSPKVRGKQKAWSPIGTLGGGKDSTKGIVDIAIMQSLISEDNVKDIVREYGMIIVDECHHISAVNFEKILKFANSKYVYGLTATPTRQDGHHPIIFMQCGPIRYSVDAKVHANNRDFEHYLIPRFTSYRQENTDKSIAEIYKDLSNNDLRNSLIVDDVIKAVSNGRVPIVLTERRKHVLKLNNLLSRYCRNTLTLFGTSSQKERREVLEKLEKIGEDEPLIIIATGKYVGEGFDYPRLDTLFLALPISWKGKVAQYAGRLHRSYPGKNEVQIYDYVDIHVPVLEKMYQKRLKGYSSIGYKLKVSDELDGTQSLIYDGKNYYQYYCKDVNLAHSEVIIVCPHMKKNKILLFSKIFSQAVQNNANITIITHPIVPSKDSEESSLHEATSILQSNGINVIFSSDCHQKFTIIDNKTIWYGNVNFLSFSSDKDSVMRFVSFDVAGELRKIVEDVISW